MFRVIDKRGTGKTSRLLLLAKENNGVIVCSNPYALREKAYRYGITGIDFFGYSELDKIPASAIVYIDDLDNFLKSQFPLINGYTITED